MKILIVEDDPEVRILLTRNVENLGYGVITAEDGQEAIGLIKTEFPDMVITDMELSKLSGPDLVSYLKISPGKRIPVILLSAIHDNGLGNSHHEHGADAYLVKPVPPTLLINTISALEDLGRFY